MSARTSSLPRRSEMRLVLAAQPSEASLARHAVTEFAREHGGEQEVQADVELALSEAFSNAVLHAYRDASVAGEVTVSAQRDGDILRVLVSDDGQGVTPRLDSPGLGLGLAIIGNVAQSLEVRDRDGGGAEICMTFDLAPVSAR